MSGEWLWLQRWRGESPKQVFAADDFPSLVELEAGWQTVEREQEQCIERLTDADLFR